MKKVILTLGILLLFLNPNDAKNASASTLNTSASILNTNPIVISSSDKKHFKVVIKRKSYDDFLEKFWHSSGGYNGYLYFTSYIIERDGFYYGTYTGDLLYGPYIP